MPISIESIPLIKDTRANRVILTVLIAALVTFTGYAIRILHELDQSSQRTETQISRFLEWRANNDESMRDMQKRIDDIEGRIDDLVVMILQKVTNDAP